MKFWPILLVLPLLSACQTPKGSIGLGDVPPSLLAPCARPVLLPERDLTRAEVTRWWAQDRAALIDCGSKVAGLSQ